MQVMVTLCGLNLAPRTTSRHNKLPAPERRRGRRWDFVGGVVEGVRDAPQCWRRRRRSWCWERRWRRCWGRWVGMPGGRTDHHHGRRYRHCRHYRRCRRLARTTATTHKNAADLRYIGAGTGHRPTAVLVPELSWAPRSRTQHLQLACTHACCYTFYVLPLLLCGEGEPLDPAEFTRRICGLGLAEKVPLRPLLPGDLRTIPPLPPSPKRVLVGVVADAEVGVRLVLLRALCGRGVYRERREAARQ
jgi:hypothetical protein